LKGPSRWLICILVVALAGLLLSQPFLCAQEQPQDRFARARERAVNSQLRGLGITDERVLKAMLEVPREEFCLPEYREQAYSGRPLPIGHGQTISAINIVGFMTAALKLQPTDVVLEIGTGSGYQAAVLSKLVKTVYSIEIIPELEKRARETLQRLGYKNVVTKAGDGYKGWPKYAPFDAIIVTCAPDHVPQPLVDQLKPGGRMIIPVGERYNQELYLLEKKGDKVVKQAVLPVLFVPMTGEAEKKPQ